MIFTDCSKWNERIDWQKAINQGVEGTYLKVGGGSPTGSYLDTKFIENSQSCPLSYRGGYWFFNYTGQSGRDQCKYFLDKLSGFGNLRGVLDLEDSSGSGWAKLSSMYGTALKEALAFKNEYLLETGHELVMYLNTGLTQLKQATVTGYKYTFRNFTSCPLWVANYNDIPVPPTGAWSTYAMWQYTSKAPGYIYGNGIGAPVIDLNIVKDLTALLKPGQGGDDQPTLTDSEKLEKLWNAHPELH
ncbi:MAG: glycoside hydrolase family 25 protein [Candidatus Paceibacterota bacterium]